MYGWMFSRLPGPMWVRVLLATALVVAAVVGLMEVVFPWAVQHSLFTTRVTVGVD